MPRRARPLRSVARGQQMDVHVGYAADMALHARSYHGHRLPQRSYEHMVGDRLRGVLRHLP